MLSFSRTMLVIGFSVALSLTSGASSADVWSSAMAEIRAAAEQGNAVAQTSRGSMYDMGLGEAEDPAKAAKWYRRAADQGHAPAQAHLGGMYVKGRGVPQDIVLAHMWLNLAASRGEAVAAEKLVKAEKKMTREQITKAQRLAREWSPKAE
jgi:TPR repeat protein